MKQELKIKPTQLSFILVSLSQFHKADARESNFSYWAKIKKYLLLL
ncbi:hypothetical protein [Hydrocoleum sp. CS-953]|nr:hypothetical protein [Hydrocoleum sp. CS-953]